MTLIWGPALIGRNTIDKWKNLVLFPVFKNNFSVILFQFWIHVDIYRLLSNSSSYFLDIIWWNEGIENNILQFTSIKKIDFCNFMRQKFSHFNHFDSKYNLVTLERLLTRLKHLISSWHEISSTLLLNVSMYLFISELFLEQCRFKPLSISSLLNLANIIIDRNFFFTSFIFFNMNSFIKCEWIFLTCYYCIHFDSHWNDCG